MFEDAIKEFCLLSFLEFDPLKSTAFVCDKAPTMLLTSEEL